MSRLEKIIEQARKKVRPSNFVLINEVKLARVWQHFTDNEIPVALITAYTKDRSEQENLSFNKKLASDVREAGYGYIFVDGMYRYKDGTKGDEQSILAVGNKKDNGRMKGLIRKWVNKYAQEAMLIKPEGTTKAMLIFSNGEEKEIGTIRPDKIADIYTKLKGHGERTFTFERAAYSYTWIQHLLREKMIRNGELNEKEIKEYRRYC